MASPIPQRTRRRAPGDRRRRRPRRWGRRRRRRRRSRRRRRRREGAAHSRARYRWARWNPRPLAAVDPGDFTRTALPTPAPWDPPSGRSMERSTTRSRPEDEPPPDRSRTRGRTRCRRDAALPRAERAQRPPAHSPAVVATRRAPAGCAAERRPAARPPAARAPSHPTVGWRRARRRCAGCPGSSSR